MNNVRNKAEHGFRAWCHARLSFGTSCPPGSQITLHTLSLYGFEEVLCLLAGLLTVCTELCLKSDPAHTNETEPSGSGCAADAPASSTLMHPTGPPGLEGQALF